AGPGGQGSPGRGRAGRAGRPRPPGASRARSTRRAVRAACAPPPRPSCAAPRATVPDPRGRHGGEPSGGRAMRRGGAGLGIAGAARRGAAAALFAPGAAAPAAAYPGGTPDFQTDVAPFCAACHSSRSAGAFEGAGERAQEELAEHKHIARILAGQRGYESLSAPDRESLVKQIRALDAASTVVLTCPDAVPAGALFEAEVDVTGGGRPVGGIGLVERDPRRGA